METLVEYAKQAFWAVVLLAKKVIGWVSILLSAEGLTTMLQQFGWVAYPVLFAIVFAETGLLVGFFLPGDSLLFITGFLCSPAAGGILKIWLVAPLLMVAAIVGDTVGYWLGRKTGPIIFCREDSLLFHRKHLIRTQRFYEKYGGRTIIYARFVPIVRTFAPFIAGVGQMEYKRFISFNVFGGIGWISSMLAAGYFLGTIPIVKHNLEKAILVVIFISFLPILIEWFRAWREKRRGEPEESVPCADEVAVAPESER